MWNGLEEKCLWQVLDKQLMKILQCVPGINRWGSYRTRVLTTDKIVRKYLETKKLDWHIFRIWNRSKGVFVVFWQIIVIYIISCVLDRLVGLVVGCPPRERMIPGSNPACAGIFLGSSHTYDLKIGTPVATLPGAWRYRVSAGTGRPSVSILWLDEMESLICNFCLSVAARKIVWADPSLRYTDFQWRELDFDDFVKYTFNIGLGLDVYETIFSYLVWW